MTQEAKPPLVHAERAHQLARDYGTPIHIYDEKSIRARARALNEAFAWNPGFREYFAVKATPNPTILRILKEEGCGCDCATATELLLADACGIRGEHVILSSNDTPVEDFRLARDLGVTINFDSDDMPTFWEKNVGTFPERICCRVNPGGSFQAANGIIGTPQDSKFGMTVDQLKATFAYLRNRGVREFGIHAFLASNTLGNDYYPLLARRLFELVRDLTAELGINITFVDLSGGVGVAYEPGEEEPDIVQVGAGVREAYEEILTPAGLNVDIYAELGRWMLGPAGALLTTVIHQKSTYCDYLGVDACAANLMRPAIYGAYHHITSLDHEGEEETGTYNVVGGLCENNDQFAKGRKLPQTSVGDLLLIHDTGAHGHAMGYNYNGKLRSAEVLLCEDGSDELIRRTERFDDYFATLDVTPEGRALLADSRRKR